MGDCVVTIGDSVPEGMKGGKIGSGTTGRE